MYNFDTIKVDYYKDPVVAVEAFKAGDFDFIPISIAKQWARDLTGVRFENGEIIKKVFPHRNNAGMQGFVMNTRKAIFHDRRVRQALGLALDFEWTNKSLFFDQYTRANSFFSNSYLAATGLPSELELQYLQGFKKDLPTEIFTTPLTPPDTNGQGGLRANLQQAKRLLAEAGWTAKDGNLKDKEGNPFRFEILLVSSAFERVIAPFANNLQKLGIQVDYRTIDPALYADRLQNFDFDMIVHTYGQSLSPGNEQRNFWHSESAKTKGSQNLAGVSAPVTDFLVEKVIYASNQEELTAACKALDRVLWYEYYLIPNWYMNGYRLAYYNKFSQPDNIPKYYNHFQILLTWWKK
jgi:microcin C transport system substrate-binding protein